MEPEDLLPENDRDLQLAQLLERTRITERAGDSLDDPLITLLLQFKEEDKAKLGRLSLNSSTIWTRIETGMQANQVPVYQLFPKSDIVRWIAAAAVVIIALTTFYWLFEGNQPDLIAESGSTISTVTLDGRSTVTLRPHSSLYEVSYSSTEQIYMVSGEAYFEVASNPNRKFIAETDEGRVIVLGTKFVLQDRENRTSVFLEDGYIRLETLDQSEFTLLEPGEFSTITKNRVSEPVRESSLVHKDWLENILVLENQSINSVLSEIEQHFNVTINGAKAPDETLGGSIQLDNLEQVLGDLSVVLGGRFEQTGGTSYEYIPEN